MPSLILTLVFAGAILGIVLTRHGTRGRLIVQVLTGLAALVLGLAAIAVLGLSGAIAVQIARGADNGFGGLAIIVGIPLGIGLGLGALWLASLALGGRRARPKAADGLTWREPPAYP